MDVYKEMRVAVLLATYNGEKFVYQQIQSLNKNSTQFQLHWLDDHSKDSTRVIVRAAAADANIRLVEWHQEQRQGLPGAFFKLLECVEADIYLFCDQDDIWQDGKIDATVNGIIGDSEIPALCFSEAWAFREGKPESLSRVFDLIGAKTDLLIEESRIFTCNPAQGNTIGLTRPLRDIFLKHKEVACTYAPSHDSWLYVIAVASGVTRLLPGVPTTLYRLHGSNAFGIYLDMKDTSGLVQKWRFQDPMRRWISRQATGFCLASSTLPQSPKLDRILSLAKRFAAIDRRVPAVVLAQLLRDRSLPANVNAAMWLTAACLCSNMKTV